MKLTLTFSIATLFALAACGDNGMMMMGDTPDTTCSATPEAVTMATLQTEIFDVKCKSCHYPDPDGTGPMTAGSGIAYGDYTTADLTQGSTAGKPSVYMGSGMSLKVVDNDTAKSTADRLANSSLWLKISTKKPTGFKGPKMEATGARMPNDGTLLTDAELKKLKDWICRGAPRS